MSIFVRFEDPSSSRVSERFGPYPFIQLAYSALRVGPSGDVLASSTKGKLWAPLNNKGHRVSNVSYSDVMIYT